ncbi:tRNA (adenosine(37)-N6)-dimethylallyltransferase, partial [Intestinimonas butyriciproducens]|uniref:tRNA (adenosine(37)-N6)-dimethylallyltransferase n=2 Tax=Eubacteriales incertae sedis TaxID=538999 RepID=UPI0034A1E76F
YEELRRVDPQRAERLPLSDEKRILRALEVWYETGETITDHDRRTAQLPSRYRALRIGLDFAQRPDLWVRIDARVDEMMDRGLEGEVRRLLSAGVPEGCTAMQAIGYKEFAAALRGEEPLSDAVAAVKLRSRQYAKRQRTWFRRNRDTNWIFWEKSPDLAAARQKATAFLEDLGLS